MAHGRTFPDDTQLEFCELCGERLPAAHRTQGTAQGLYGRWLCPKCARFGTNPSWRDMQSAGATIPMTLPIEPHSGVDWITEDQGGTTAVSTFYAGATVGEAPADDLALSSSTYPVRAVPFSMPRPASSNTVSTIQVVSAGYAGSIKAAIYTQAGMTMDRVGLLVSDLGTQTVAANGTATFDVDIFLNGAYRYFVLLYGSGAGVLRAFTNSQSSELIADGVSSLGSPRGWYSGSGAWPLAGSPIPWTRLATNFFAITVNLET